ncbi:MAG TPA: rhamnogalacturonan lyase, partial [Sedimentisphaerales bacterium]|nr:rhamnogalacturonan lyase [Sedimentisphaerales bacterium]
VSWRLLGTDPEDIAFNVYRQTDGRNPVKLNEEPLTGPTHWQDSGVDLATDNSWFVRPVVEGREQNAGEPFTIKAGSPVRNYIPIPLKVPAPASLPDGSSRAYVANDASVGDLNGDGEYEIVLKWEASPRDNSHSGHTSSVLLDAYRLDGTHMWRIDLGVNVREGAHYTQFMVYDLDGDGRAEIVIKTAPGTKDGKGMYIGHPSRFTGVRPEIDHKADYRNERGHILQGPEFLTVFDGLTGAELATTNYIPPRHPETLFPTGEQLREIWGDGRGNRSERFLAAVAYLDGKRPSVVMARGYYTRMVLAAFDWRDGKLTHRWTFDSDDGTPGNRAYHGQGNHNLSVADVTGDGRDEIIYGSSTIGPDGKGLYSTGLGHGDALHVTNMDPSRPGLEVFMPHESMHSSGNRGTTMRCAATGRILWSTEATRDVGRGMAADIDPRHPGYEAWASNSGNLYNIRGEAIGRRPGSMNMAIWWDGDLLRELLDQRGPRGNWHGVIHKWNYETQTQEILWEDTEARPNNWTKGNPALSADILGDWREEMVWRTADSSELRIYTTTIPTEYRIYTLMHDPQYRLAIAWQNVAYNQPPHPGFFLGHGMKPAPPPRITTVSRHNRDIKNN